MHRIRVARLLVTGGLLALGLAAVTSPAGAAPPPGGGFGRIVGRVFGSDGLPMAAACVSTDSGGSATTAPDGSYELAGVPSGRLHVRIEDCSPTPTHAPEWYPGKDHRAQAWDVDVRDGADTPLPDVLLRPGGRISGSVTKSGTPIGGYCVLAIADGDTLAKARSDATGSYSLGPLAPDSYVVQFLDCRGLGQPFPDQWYPDVLAVSDALVVSVGATRDSGGIDAHLGDGSGSTSTTTTTTAPPPVGGTIAGIVTDASHAPLDGICVQALATSSVADATETASDGTFVLAVPAATPVRVQFVDCAATTHAGQWYPGAATEAESATITLAPGGSRPGVDAVMSPGATGSISGRVTNRHGIAMRDACVVAYLPYHYTVPALVAVDGTFTITGVPSGTYSLGYFACPPGAQDPSPFIVDPEDPDLVYAATFWPHGDIRLDSERVDPYSSGGGRVVVAAGAAVSGRDICFGCVSLAITSITTGDDGAVVVHFTSRPTATVLATGPSVAAVPPGVAYTATCTSPTGVTGSATGGGSPLTVAGLTPGGSYSCTVSASDGTSVIGSSVPAATVLATDVDADGRTSDSADESSDLPDEPSGPPGSLAATGSPSGALAALGSVLIGIGLVLRAEDRRRLRR